METKQKLTLKKEHKNPVIGESIKSHANDSYVLGKVEKAKEFLAKHPIPDHILKSK